MQPKIHVYAVFIGKLKVGHALLTSGQLCFWELVENLQCNTANASSPYTDKQKGL